jgi:hypothetical protein
MSLERVILNWPTALDLKDQANAAPRSWIQLASVGKFVSKRYGRFEISRSDLSQMLTNFNEVTPKAPTELPVDYDHLGMDPKKPFDAIAAGWMKRLELRADGDELWAEVEWTPRAADAIKNREYRFVSPSFIKDHTHKDGTKIGTTLLAAAITNSPFLEGMAAVTLNTPAIAAMHLSRPLRDLVAVEDAAVALSATIGQRVSVHAQQARHPRHVGATFEVLKVDDKSGYDDARVWLKDVTSGEAIGWYAASELEPAPAPNPDPSTPEKSEDPMKPEERILMRAQIIASERQISLSAATKLASREDEAASREYLAHPEPTAEPSPVISLRRHDGEGFAELVGRVQRERRIDLRSAIRVVGESYPELAAEYETGESL